MPPPTWPRPRLGPPPTRSRTDPPPPPAAAALWPAARCDPRRAVDPAALGRSAVLRTQCRWAAASPRPCPLGSSTPRSGSAPAPPLAGALVLLLLARLILVALDDHVAAAGLRRGLAPIATAAVGVAAAQAGFGAATGKGMDRLDYSHD